MGIYKDNHIHAGSLQSFQNVYVFEMELEETASYTEFKYRRTSMARTPLEP